MMKATQFLMLLDTILVLNNIIVLAVNSSNSSRHGVGLRAVYDCACPGHNAIYECTVSGAGTTVWGGEAFDCPGTDNVINLRHRATINSMSERECSSGAITGRLIHAQPEQGLYTSQLMVNVSSLDTNGTTIECYYDNGSTVIEVGTSVLTTTRDAQAFPQLNESDIRLVEMCPSQLIFEWSEALYNCPLFQYRIVASNCGQCPNTTKNTIATCFGDFTESVNCSFSIESVLCNDIKKRLASIYIETSISNLSSECIENKTSAPGGKSNYSTESTTENTNQDSTFIIIGTVVIAIALLVGIALILGVALVYVIVTRHDLRGQAENTHTSPKPETNRTQDATNHDQDYAVYSLLQSTGIENDDNVNGRTEATVVYAEVGDHNSVRLQTLKPLDDDRVQYSEVVRQKETVCDQQHHDAFDSEQ